MSLIVPLRLDPQHLSALDAMAQEQGLTRSALLRQCLRLYQTVHDRAKRGEQLAFVKHGKVVPVIAIPMMNPEVR